MSPDSELDLKFHPAHLFQIKHQYNNGKYFPAISKHLFMICAGLWHYHVLHQIQSRITYYCSSLMLRYSPPTLPSTCWFTPTTTLHPPPSTCYCHSHQDNFSVSSYKISGWSLYSNILVLMSIWEYLAYRNIFLFTSLKHSKK